MVSSVSLEKNGILLIHPKNLKILLNQEDLENQEVILKHYWASMIPCFIFSQAKSVVRVVRLPLCVMRVLMIGSHLWPSADWGPASGVWDPDVRSIAYQQLWQHSHVMELNPWSSRSVSHSHLFIYLLYVQRCSSPVLLIWLCGSVCATCDHCMAPSQPMDTWFIAAHLFLTTRFDCFPKLILPHTLPLQNVCLQTWLQHSALSGSKIGRTRKNSCSHLLTCLTLQCHLVGARCFPVLDSEFGI